MQKLAKSVIVVAATIACLVHQTQQAEYKITRELTQQVLEEAKTWTPYDYEKNPFKNDEDVRKRSGLLLLENTATNLQTGLLGQMLKTYKGLIGERQLKQTSAPIYKDHAWHLKVGFPFSFDARLQWPGCVGAVRNQQGCGSCYAFSATGMLADRYCIASQGQIKVVLSPEDMVTCNFGNAGCDGGLLSETVNYLITEGVVTEQCKPYVSGEAGINGFCQYQCTDLNMAYEKYACKLGSGKMLSTYDEIMNELLTYGPVQVGFVAYDDFYTYSSGIYEKTPSATVFGGHAVKLIGWNYDSNGRLYWICENEWGISWGQNGFFNIYAGQCGLDSLASSCDPDITTA